MAKLTENLQNLLKGARNSSRRLFTRRVEKPVTHRRRTFRVSHPTRSRQAPSRFDPANHNKAKKSTSRRMLSHINENSAMIDMAGRQAALVQANAIYAHIDTILKSDPATGPSTDEIRKMHKNMISHLKIASKGGKQTGTGPLWGQVRSLLERIVARGRIRSAAAIEAKKESDAVANDLANIMRKTGI